MSALMFWMSSIKSAAKSYLEFIQSSKGCLDHNLLFLSLCGQHLLPQGSPPTAGVLMGLLRMLPWTEWRKNRKEGLMSESLKKGNTWIMQQLFTGTTLSCKQR